MSAQKQRRRHQRHRRSRQRHCQQRLHVAVSRSGELNGALIDNLLAGQLHAADQPSDRGVEPEDAADHFFEDLVEPIATPHVNQLVVRDRFLHVRFRAVDPRRQDDNGIEETKRHRPAQPIGHEEPGCDPHLRLCPVEGSRQRVERRCGPAQASQAGGAEHQPDAPRQRTAGETPKHRLRRWDDTHHHGHGRCSRFRSGDADCDRLRLASRFRARSWNRDGNGGPLLTERQHQTQQQQAAPIDQRYPCIANAQGVKHRRPRAHHERQLNGERRDIAEPERWRHFFSFNIRLISRISASVSCSSSIMCSSSGRTEPLNTRSMNSRTMARTTCCFGFAGRYT